MANSIPAEFLSHFKYSRYDLIDPYSLLDYSEGRYGHLFWDNLMKKGDFHMKTYINASEEVLAGQENQPIVTRVDGDWYHNVFLGDGTRDFITQFIYLIDVGAHCCGHNGVWHGGVTSALFDNGFGVLGCTLLKKAATKYINIQFKAPIMVGDSVAMIISFDPAKIAGGEKKDRFIARGEMYNQRGVIVATSESELVDVSSKWNNRAQ